MSAAVTIQANTGSTDTLHTGCCAVEVHERIKGLSDDFAEPEEPTRPLAYQHVPFETFERLAMSERPTRDLKRPATERTDHSL